MSFYDEQGFDTQGFNASGYTREGKNRFGFDPFAPTPSGSNFGDTVTGEQDIYHDPGEMRPYTDSGEQDPYHDPGEMRPYTDSGEQGNIWTQKKWILPGPGSGESFVAANEKMQKYLDQKAAMEDADWARPRTGGRTTGGSGGGGMTFGQARTTVTTPTRPRGPMPEAGEMPTFSAPTRDQGRIKELTQQKSAAGLRAMRAQIQKAMGQGYRNPNVKRMTLRDALAGYGQGIENVMTGAQTAAGQEYNTEYASAYDTAGKNWQTAYQTKMQDWQNKVNDYFKQYGTVSNINGIGG